MTMISEFSEKLDIELTLWSKSMIQLHQMICDYYKSAKGKGKAESAAKP